MSTVAEPQEGAMMNGAVASTQPDRPKALKERFSRRQWLLLANLAYGNFCLGATSSLLSPFFPQEAEKHGASATEYGFVFTVFHICIFVTSPLFGKMVATMTPKFFLNVGMFAVGLCSVLFGFLDKSPPEVTFISLALAIRILEGVGTAAYRTSCFAIVAGEFEKVASVYAFLETMFGSGLIVGPALGGVLFQLGGFILPFVSFGVAMLLCAFVTIFLLPSVDPLGRKQSGKLMQFVLHPSVILSILIIAVSTFNIGFYQVTLEPHLRQFNLTPVAVGLCFILSGVMYGLSASVWGFLCDKKLNPKILSIVTCLFPSIAFLFIGPAPFFRFNARLWLVLTCLAMVGTGMSGSRVCAFSSCLQDSYKRGLPKNLATNGLVSGVMTSSISVGFFFGPTTGGYMMDTIGFRKSSFVVFLVQLVMITILIVYVLLEPCIWRKTDNEREPLVLRSDVEAK